MLGINGIVLEEIRTAGAGDKVIGKRYKSNVTAEEAGATNRLYDMAEHDVKYFSSDPYYDKNRIEVAYITAFPNGFPNEAREFLDWYDRHVTEIAPTYRQEATAYPDSFWSHELFRARRAYEAEAAKERKVQITDSRHITAVVLSLCAILLTAYAVLST